MPYALRTPRLIRPRLAATRAQFCIRPDLPRAPARALARLASPRPRRSELLDLYYAPRVCAAAECVRARRGGPERSFQAAFQ
jgi:hypothetical protein